MQGAILKRTARLWRRYGGTNRASCAARVLRLFQLQLYAQQMMVLQNADGHTQGSAGAANNIAKSNAKQFRRCIVILPLQALPRLHPPWCRPAGPTA